MKLANQDLSKIKQVGGDKVTIDISIRISMTIP